MTPFVTLLIYVSGVLMAYYQVQRWCGCGLSSRDEYHKLFMLSLTSWLIYPIYCIVWALRKAEEK